MLRSFRHLPPAALAVALLLPSSGSAAPSPGAEEPTTEQAPIVVCVRPNEGFLTLDEGEPTGVEYDLLSGFARAQRRPLELLWLDSFRELLPGVADGRCDIGSSAVTVTEERQRLVSFSRPYFPVRTVLAEPRDRDPLSLEALAGERVAAVAGTTHVARLYELGAEDVLELSTDEALFQAVLLGEARALAADSSMVAHQLEHYPTLRVGAMLSDPSHFAFALPLSSPLHDALDAYLADAEENGRYRESIARHFGEEFASFLLD